MNLFLKIALVLTMIFFLHVGDGYTDTVLLRNGDTLIGDIQNEYFVVRGSYSQIIIKKQFCKNLIMDTDQVSTGSVKTINNDRISGPILNGNIQIRLSDDTRETTFDTKELKSIFFEVPGPSRQVSTTIFTMRDGDRFSGTLLNPLVKVQTEYMTAAYPGTELNRIDFASDAPDKVKLLLINGDVIQGKLLIDAIRIAPDSFAPLTADPSEFSSIQFNARKMLLKEFSGSSDPIKDADRDGVPDHADHCSNTPWGEPVDAERQATGGAHRVDSKRVAPEPGLRDQLGCGGVHRTKRVPNEGRRQLFGPDFQQKLGGHGVPLLPDRIHRRNGKRAEHATAQPLPFGEVESRALLAGRTKIQPPLGRLVARARCSVDAPSR